MSKTDNLVKEIEKLGYEVGQTGYKDQEQIDRNEFNYRYWRHPKENYKLQDTPFYLSSENDFIHFTTLDALYSILNTGFLRLYNLNNMDDKYEMEYAIKELEFKETAEKAKEELYCLSMCSSAKIFAEKTKEHLLWKLHGRDGNGVIIRVKIENNLKWYFYHLTEVYYGVEKFGSVKNFNTQIDNQILDNKICCYIKHPIYKFESEVRLVFDNMNPVTVTDKDKQKVYPITYPDKLHKLAKTFYFQVPILNFHKNENYEKYLAPNMQGVDYEIPKIKITEIILGYRYTDKDLKNIKSKIDPKYSDIDIRITDLKELY